jgi:serine phosphatase RsbU (regulator of sigma subunit)
VLPGARCPATPKLKSNNSEQSDISKDGCRNLWKEIEVANMHKKLMHKKFRKVKDFFELYTSGLDHKEIERLLKKDTVDAFSYYKRKTGLPDKSDEKSSIGKTLHVVKEIFLSFVMQLTPARRLFYGIGFIVFVIGLLSLDLRYLIGSFVVINLLLALELADKLTTRDELEIAREIQVSLQPEIIPEIPILSISAFSKPARVVGGDFYDIVKRNEGQMLSILGDVSGKGMPAALYAASIQSMFESLSEKSVSPGNILHSLNKLIIKRLREGDFITAVIAFFELEEKSLTIARAGHNWPLYYCAQTQTISALKPKGQSIGLFADSRFADNLEEKKLYLSNGDVLLLYSDGITEAMDPKNHMFNQYRLESALKESIHKPAEEIIRQINYRLDEFVKSEEPHDDITMVAIKVK